MDNAKKAEMLAHLKTCHSIQEWFVVHGQDLVDLLQPNPNESPLRQLLEAVHREAGEAVRNWPPYNSAHEGFAVLMEEVDELKAHVWMNQKKRNIEAMLKEALQVSAVALRFAYDVCNEETGRK